MGSSTPSTQNVVQSTQIPQYQQDYAIENENVARDIAARPFEQYQGQRIADLTTLQNAGIERKADIGQNPGYGSLAGNAEATANNLLVSAYGGAPASYISANPGAGAGHFTGNLNPASIAPWMSPYIAQALQPQIQEIQRQSALTAKGINAGATGAGAFGDARLGVQQGENDRNTNQLIANTVGTGYQNAYDRAVAASQGAFGANAGQFNAEDAAQRAAVSENAGITQGNNQSGLATFGANAGQFNTDLARRLAAAGQLPVILAGGYGVQQQQADDLLSAGKLQQDQTQQGLSTAYQDFSNQFQYPQEQLNLRLATQQGSPYNTTRLTQTPYSPAAQNIGALASLFGFLGRPAGGTAA